MSETKGVRWKVRYDLENSLADNKGCVKCLFLVCLHCRPYCLSAANFSAFPAQLMKRRKNSFSIRHWGVLVSLGDPQTLWKLSPLCLALALTILSRKATFSNPRVCYKAAMLQPAPNPCCDSSEATQPFLLTAMKLMVTFRSMNAFHGAHSKKKWTTILIKELAF